MGDERRLLNRPKPRGVRLRRGASSFIYVFKMSTYSQIGRKKKARYSKNNFSRTNSLAGGPHAKGIVNRLAIVTPKKPNSALRHVAKLTLYKTNRRVIGRVPGIGFLCSKYNRVLIRGGRANDLPGIRHTLVRGVYDFVGIYHKKKRRSVYGTPRPEGHTSHVRRCFRMTGYA